VKYCDTCHSAYPDDFAICPRDQGPLRVASELLPGMVLRGKYEVLEKIGSGGMASVYRARHTAFAEVCAIKVVAGKLAHDDTFLKRFRNEAVVTRRLQHPHAVRVDDLDTTEDGRPFIVMEFVDGRNLRDVIRQEAPLHPRRALLITRQVASALAAAHALGIVHRDIKPDNILLTRGADGGDLAKVLDFGIAKVKEHALGEEAYTPTRTGMVVGTPQYVSPEQAMGKRGEDIDGRSDLYSLGVVLYEMLTGRLPFASDTAMGMILHHLQTSPTPPHLARPDLNLPTPLSNVLMTALQKEPGGRFAGADDMVAELDRVIEELPALPGAAVVGAPSAPLRTPTPTSAQRAQPPLPPLPGRITPPSRTPPPLPLPTPPPPPATSLQDISDRPTRMFPGGEASGAASSAGGGAPTLMGPGGGRLPTPPTPGFSPGPPAAVHWMWVRQAALWTVVGGLVASFFVANQRRRESAEVQQLAEQASSPEAAESAPPDDGDLQDGIENLLGNARATRQENIDVDVSDGVATLSGMVEDPAAARVAEALAESFPGIKSVENKIELHQDGGAQAKQKEKHGVVAGPGEIVIPMPNIPHIPPVLIAPMGPRNAPPAPGTPQAEALAELLKEGRKALAGGRHEEAIGIYTAALMIDNRNLQARQGMQQAARMMRRQFGREEMTAPPAPPAAPVPSVNPAPRASPGG
jgi:serine/threonine protein kinase